MVVLEELQLLLEEDIATEFTNDDEYDATLMASKITNAINEVQSARRYQSAQYTPAQVAADIEQFYPIIRTLALADYSKAGIETEIGHSESGTSATYMDRRKLLSGVIPLARML